LQNDISLSGKYQREIATMPSQWRDWRRKFGTGARCPLPNFSLSENFLSKYKICVENPPFLRKRFMDTIKLLSTSVGVWDRLSCFRLLWPATLLLPATATYVIMARGLSVCCTSWQVTLRCS